MLWTEEEEEEAKKRSRIHLPLQAKRKELVIKHYCIGMGSYGETFCGFSSKVIFICMNTSVTHVNIREESVANIV